MVLGTMSAFAITRFKFRGRGFVAGLIGAPLVVPWLMIGIGAAIFFFHYQIPDHVPAVAVLRRGGADRLHLPARDGSAGLPPGPVRGRAGGGGDRPGRIADAGAAAGSSCPQLTPALGAAAIFAFSWSFNNFEIDFFVGGYDQTFPVWVYSELRRAPNLPIINASSTLISAIQVIMVIFAWRLLARDESDERRTATAVIDALS